MLLLCLAAVPVGAGVRRRVVAPGPSLVPVSGRPDLVVPITSASTVHLTNHGETATVTVCALHHSMPGRATRCMHVPLARGASTHIPAADLQVSQPTVAYLTSTNTVHPNGIAIEARADGSLAVNVDRLAGIGTDSTLFAPLNPAAPATLMVFSTSEPVTGVAHLIERFGGSIEATPFTLPAYASVTLPLYGTPGWFREPKNATTIDIAITSGNFTGASLHTTTAVTLARLTRDAGTRSYLLADETSTLRVQNTFRFGPNVIDVQFLQPPSTSVPHRSITLGNAEVQTVPNILQTIGVSGMGVLRMSSVSNQPFEVDSITTETARASVRTTDTAIAKSGSPSDTVTPRDASINGLTTADDLLLTNVSSADGVATLIPITGTLTITGDDGVMITSTPLRIPAFATARYSLKDLASASTVNATVHLDQDPVAGRNINPEAILTTTNATMPFTYAPLAPSQYDVTALLRVRDHQQTLEQVTHPSIATVLQLAGIANPESAVGTLGFPCATMLDPVVNTVDELLANYRTLTAAEQQEFSGDRDGFLPFITNAAGGSPCDPTDPDGQYMLFVRITVERATLSSRYVSTYFDALRGAPVYLNPREARCMLRGNCGVPSITTSLASILARGVGETRAPAALEHWLLDLTDTVTSPASPELWQHDDPFTWNPSGISLHITTSQTTFTNEPGTVHLLPADATAAAMLIRAFLIDYVAAHPDEYGGNPTDGPNLAVDPTWRTNDADGTIPTTLAMTTILGVWQDGQALQTAGTTRDRALMRIITGTTDPAPTGGLVVFSNANPNYQELQRLIDRITTSFRPEDYQSVFNESFANITPFVTDYDNDGYVIDCGSTDFPGDNATSAPANQARGVRFINYLIERVPN